MAQLLYSHVCGQQLLRCILVGYIWIWSGACDQESNNHIACFVEWKSRYIIITSKHLHIWRYNTCFQLERLETTCSNSPPHPDKVQILHPPGTEDVQMPVGYPGGEGRGDVEALNWSLCKCLLPYNNLSVLIFTVAHNCHGNNKYLTAKPNGLDKFS